MRSNHNVAIRIAMLLIVTLAFSRTGLAQGSVKVSPGTLKFGQQSVGTVSDPKSVTLSNNQNVPLAVSSIVTTQHFLASHNCGTQLPAKSQCTIGVRFAPEADGPLSGRLTVTHNGAGGQLIVDLSGTGRIPVTMSPSSLSFGPETVGNTSAPKAIVLTNRQAVALTVTGVAASGDFSQTNDCGTVAVNGTCTISVRFRPTTTGARTGSLVVTHSAPNSPQSAALTGTGTTPGLVSIAVTPANSTVALGRTQQFTATGTFANGSTQILTASATWASSSTAVASISNAAGSAGLATTLAEGPTTITATVAGVVGQTSLIVGPPQLVSIAVTPPTPSIALGRTQQFAATGTYTNNTTQILTAAATWTSSNQAVATINSAGLAASVSEGSATISAAVGTVSGAALLSVSPPVIDSIAVSPATVAIDAGRTQTFTAVATYSDRRTEDVTALTTWRTDNSVVLSVGADARTTGLHVGTAAVIGQVGDVSGSATVHVRPAVATAVSVAPTSASVLPGGAQPFTATVTYSDGSSRAATSAGGDAFEIVYVSDYTFRRTTSIGVGSFMAIVNTGTQPLDLSTLQVLSFTDDHPQAQFTFNIQQGSNAMLAPGSASGALSSAALGLISSTGLLPEPRIDFNNPFFGFGLTEIPQGSSAVINASVVLRVGTQQVTLPFTFRSVDEPGNTVSFVAPDRRGITTAVWSSALTSVATISNATASYGVAAGLTPGTTTVSATSGAASGSATLAVAQPAAVIASVSPTSASQGRTLDISVTGQYTNFVQGQTTASFGAGITVNSATVTSPTSATVNVSIALDAALGARSVTLTTGGEVVSAAGVFSVTQPALQSIATSPPLQNVPLGLTQQFTAIGTYDNAQTTNLTASVTWSSSVPAVATINGAGLASTLTRGTTTITATLGAVSGTATLSVIDPQLTSIAIAPTHASIVETQTQQFTAMGTYTDGSIQDVTALALWSTGQPSIATIAAGGVATGTGVGFTTVTAMQGAISGSSAIYVRRAAAPQFAFATQGSGSPGSGSVSAWTVDALTGALTPAPGSPYITGGSLYGAAVTPDNRFLYVTDALDNRILGYSIDAQTGALAAVPGSPVSALRGPKGITIHPSGRFLYVALSLSNQILGYAIDQTTGALTPVPGSGAVIGGSAESVAAHPSGAFVYGVASSGSPALATIAVDQTTGAMTLVGSTPLVGGGVAIAVDATGRFAYVSGFSTPALYGFALDQGTGLPTALAANTLPGSFVPWGLGLHPNGLLLYASQLNSNRYAGFRINPTSGALSPVPGSTFVATNAAGTAVDPSGRFLYLAGFGSPVGVSAASLSALGVPTPIPGSPFPTPRVSVGVAVAGVPSALDATLTAIEVRPATTSAHTGGTVQFTARGIYSDGSARFVTASATWSSLDVTVAAISNSAGANGRATAGSPGVTTITATLNGVSGTASLTVTAPPLVSIAVTPANTSIQTGATQQFVATGTYADNSTQVITNAVTWSSSLTSVATISDAVGTRGLATGVSGGLTNISATLDGISGTTQLTVTVPTPLLVSVAPASAAQGQTIGVIVTGQFTHFVQGQTTASFGGGITVNSLTAVSPTSATVNLSVALDAALGVRVVTLTTGAEVVSAAGLFSVTQPVLQSMAVIPPLPNVPLGLTQQFTAIGTYDNALTADLTASVTWSSSVPAVATISNTAGSNGLATSVSAGTTTITATLANVTGSGTLTVGPPAVATVIVSPVEPTILEGRSQQLTATATLTNGVSQDVTSVASWTSASAAVADVDAQGLVTAVAAGSTTITATYNGVSGTAAATVRAALRLTKYAYVVNQNSNSISGYTVDAEDGSLTPVPNSPFPTGSLPASAAVHPSGKYVYVPNFSGNTISLYGVQPTGALQLISVATMPVGSLPFCVAVAPSRQFAYVVNRGAATVSVHAVNPTTGTLTPVAGATIATGSNPIYAAMHPSGRFLYVANAGTANVSAFSIDPTTGFLTVVPGSPFAAGTQPIEPVIDPTGRYLYVVNQGSNNVHGYTIDPGTGALLSIGGSPYPTGSLPVGIQVDPTGRFVYIANDGSDNVSVFSLNSSDGVLAPIAGSPFAGGDGNFSLALTGSGRNAIVANNDADTVSVYALNQSTGAPSSISGSPFPAGDGPRFVAVVNDLVDDTATLASIAVTPLGPTVTAGTALQFTAVGNYSDGSQRFLTSSAVWSSTDASIATISNTAGFKGRATALTSGLTTITATLNGITGTATLTVTAAPLVSIAVTPPNTSIQVGATQQFVATGTYADNSTQVITNAVTWSTALSAVATISNAAATRGVATGVGAGQTDITATLDGIAGSTQLTVTAAPVVTSVAPASGAQGQTLNVTITGQATHFVQGQTTASFGGGITVNAVTVTSSTAATLNISIAINAAPGARTVTMTTGAEVVSSAAGAFTVTVPVLVQLTVTPPAPNVPLGLTQQFTATGTYDNALSADLTASVTWSSSIVAVATINAMGLASTVTRGSSIISATLGAVSGTATLSVTDPALTAIAILPGHASIVETQTQQFAATGTYTDGSTQDVTTSALWSTDQPSIATIAAGGLASGAGVGFTAVTATQGAISGAATIYVRRAMAPQFAFVANQTGSVSVFTVDALTGGLTPVAGSPFAAGLFPWGVAATPDQRFVYLTNQGGASVSGYAVNAQTGALTPIPGSPFAAAGQPRGLAAHPSGRFLYVANAGTGQVNGYAINQSTGALVPVPGAGAVVGSFTSLVTAHPSGAFLYAVASSGNTLASIAVNDITGEIVTVGSTATDANPAALAVDPIGRYAFVGSGTPATMRVYALDQSSGVASPVPANTIPIPFAPHTMAMHPNGTFMYAGSGNTTFLGFRVNPISGAVTLLSTPAFTGNAYAIAVDPSGLFGYRTNDVASNVSAFGIDSTGLPTTVAGSPFATGGTPRVVDISGAASALNATLTAIEVRPATVSVQTGATVQFTARGIYNDGSARFLTMSATWSSLDPSVATISNVAGSNGIATALTPGLTTVSATFNGVTGTASLSVTAPPLVSIAVTPANTSIQVGAAQQFAATGTYADNSTQVITNAVTWTSSLTSIASISNDAATRGRATGVDVGETIISATFDGVTGSTGLTVTAGNASILSVVPNQGGAGQTLSLLVTGRFTNFVQGLTTASLGADVVVNSVTVASATSATISVSIAAGASVGSRSLTITSGAESVSIPFTVLPAPTISAITPDNAQQGQTLDVAITGENTHFAAGQTTVSFGADVAVTALQVVSPTSLVATISIGANAVASPRTVTAATGSETVSLVDGFTVLSSVALLSSLTPSGGQQGQQVVVQVVGLGTHFVQGQTTATFGQGISIQSLTITSATSATVTVLIDPLAAVGSREVTLATGTEFATRSTGFTVFPGPARLESFSPTTARQGDSLTIEVTGFDTHFAQSATIASFGPGIVIGNVQITSPTRALVDIAVDVTASLGLRTIILSTGGESASNGDRFQILPGIPQVASITPNTGVQGGTATVAITARFTHFVEGQTNVSFGTGILVTNFTVTSPTTASATITISPTTPTGARNVTLTTGGEIVTATGAFSILNGPAVITQISPASATQGDTLTVEITGQLTHFAEGVTLIGFGPPQPSIGIQVLSLTINSSTSATAQIEIPADAVPGLWSISVTTSGEVATRSAALTVLPGTPVLSTVSPQSAAQGQTRDVVVTGRFTTFVQGQTTASFGEGVTVNSVTVTSPTSATVNLSVGLLAFTGLRNVTLTTGQQILSRTNGFSVVPGPARLASVTPNQGQQGQTLTIDIVGAESHFEQGVTTLTLSGATTVSLTVTGPTTATAVVTIDPFATPGPASVTMTTLGENASLSPPFTILPGTPVITIVVPGTGQQGQALDVDVTGRFTHFVNGQTTANFGAGVSTNTVAVTGPTTATVNVTIDPLTLTGLRTVTMTTGSETATGPQLFSVVPGIAILTALSPAEGQQGQTLDVAITGRDTHFAAGATSVDFGGGVDVNRFTVTSPTQASANITIQPLAAIGLRTVALRTAGESALRVNGFNVLAGTPIVTSVTPNAGRQGESVSVTILGQFTNFQQGITTADFGAGVAVTLLTINGPTSATATLSIDPITPAGGRVVTLTTGTQIASGGGFLVTPGPAVLTQVTPENARQGQSQSVSVVGLNTHFAGGVTTATVSGTGASAGAVTVTSPTSASFTITLEPFATPGPRTVTLTTAGEVASIVDGFTVIAGTPRITAVTPSSGTQGQSLQVTITGQFTSFQTGQTTMAFGEGIQVTSVNVTSATTATASVTISPLAAIGGRTVVATTNQEIASSSANAFAVQAGSAAVATLTPNAGRQAELLSVEIVGSGTHFAAGTSAVDFGSGIAVSSFIVTSPTQATASISIAATASIGARTVTVTTAGEIAQIVNGFTVLVGTPRVTQLSPVSGRQAQTLDITISGQFTHFVQGLTTANFGAGIATTALAVTAPTVAVATIAIQPSATVGVRSVTVTTGSEVAASVVGFNVTPGQPVVASVTPTSGVQGQSLTVAIAGQFTNFTAGVSTVSLGSGISIGAVTVNGPTQLTVPITVSPGASTGPRTATVTTNGEVATLSNAFTVNAGSPSITILNPNVGSPNSSVQVQITGQFTNFVGGQTVASFGPNISVGGGAVGAAGPVVVSGPTTATAQLTIQAGATLGARDVTVQTGAETITVFGGFTVATNDGVAPAVLRVSPASGATGVPINTEAEVEFTEPVDRASATTASVGLRDDTTSAIVPATVVLDATGRIATIRPTALLSVNRGYTVLLSFNTRIRDAAGNQMFQTSAGSFTTGLSTDTTGPALLVASPAQNATAVPLNVDVVLQFDKPINPVTRAAGVQVSLAGVPVLGSYSFSIDNRVLTFQPTSNLSANTQYTVTLTSLLTDVAGNSITNPGVLSFTTGTAADTTGPAIVTFLPVASAEHVGTNVVPYVAFSERINPISVRVDNVQLTYSQTGLRVPVTHAVSADLMSVTLTPIEPLIASAQYQVSLSSVTDLAGNSSPFTTWTFFTGVLSDTTGPVVEGVSPLASSSNVPVNAKISVRFDEPVADPTPQPGTIAVVPSGGSAVAGSLTLSSDRRTATFTAAASLAASTTYTVAVTGYRDDTGNVVTPFTSTFTTRASTTVDLTGPAVTAVQPGNGATGVSVTAPVILTFSEPIDPTTMDAGIAISVSGQSGEIAGSFVLSGSTVTFTPLTPLPGDTLISVTVSNGQVRDLAGNASQFFTSSFRTAAVADTTPPTVLSVLPTQGTTDVGSQAEVVLTFSESLNAATVSNTTFGLFANDDWLGISVLRSADNRTITLKGTLPAGSVITVVATGDVTDLSNNHLADFSSSFTTAPAVETLRPSIVRQRPGNAVSGVRADTPIVLYASEPLDAATVSPAVFVAANGMLVSGATVVSGGGQTITFTPDAPFAPGTHVEIFVEPTATDLAGNLITRYQGNYNVAVDPATTAPALVRTNPSSGQQPPRNVRIELEFSEELDPPTVDASTVVLRQNGSTPVTAAITVERGGRVIRIAPSAELNPNTFYTYQVTTGVRDLQGTPLAATINGSFTTEATSHIDAPSVVSVSPPMGATGVGVNAEIHVEFTEAVNPISVTTSTISILDGAGAILSHSIVFSEFDRAVTIVPHRALAADQIIEVIVNGVEDVAGNLVVPHTSSFGTGAGPDVSAPIVLRTSPTNAESNVPVNSVITLEFNEPIDPTTVADGTSLVDGATSLAVPVARVVSGDRIVTLRPLTPLAVSHSYQLRVLTGLKDLAGNTSASVMYSFTTALAEDVIAPVIVSTSPRTASIAVPTNVQLDVLFNEPISVSSLGQLVLRRASTVVGITTALSDSNRRLTISPTVPLQPSATHVLTIAGVSDSSGNVAATQTLTFTTGPGADLVSPIASIVSPPSGADGVGTNASVLAQFSERVNPVSVNSTSFRLLRDGSVPVSATIVVATDGLSATLMPASPLTPYSSYSVQLTSGVTDLVARSIGFSSSSFKTGGGIDSTGPAVIEVSPANGTSAVPVNARVVIRVDEPITAISLQPGTVAITPPGGSAISGTLSISSSDRQTITFIPSSLLLPNTSYNVTVSGFRDDAGNAVAFFSSTFSTRASTATDITGPSVVSQTPVGGATGVGVTTPVVMTFSEPVDPTSVPGNIAIRLLNQTGNLAGSFSVNGPSVTFTPLTPYPGDAFIQTSMSGVRDFAGNPGQFFTATFRTAAVTDAAPPTVVSVSPLDGAVDLGPYADVVLTFSESLDASTVNTSTFGLFANNVWLSAQVNRSSDNRTVTLTTTLPPFSVITVVATADVTDLSGNHLADFRSSFTTLASQETTRPMILRQRPASGTVGVRADVPIVLYVDEPLSPSTVPGAVFVAADGVLVAGQASVSGGGQVITFAPSSPFAAGTHVEVFVETTATDLSGNALVRYQSAFTVASDPAVTAPTLLGRNPSNSSGVPRNVRIELEFSEPLNPTSVSDSSAIVRNGSSVQVPASVTLVRGGRVIRITPATVLDANASYSYQLLAGIVDLQGTPVPSFISGSFTTAAASDTIPPMVAGISPPAGAADVGVNTTIYLAMSESVNPLSVNEQTVAVSDSSGALLASSIVFSDSDRSITFSPHRALRSGETVQIAVNGIEDVAGNLVTPQTTTFATRLGADVTPPTVTAVSPYNGQLDAPVNVVPAITFSEPIDPTSITGGVVLRDNQTGGVVQTSVSLGVDNRTVSIQPGTALQPNLPYGVNISAGLRDLSGNPASPTSFSFRTSAASDTTAPEIVVTSPTTGATAIPINAQLVVQFDEPVAEYSLTQVVLRTGGNGVPMTLVLSDSNRRLTILPTVPLLGLTSYTLTIAGVADTSGNVAATESVSFVTAAGSDLRSPDVVTYSPAANATGVSVNTVVTIQFSERVNPLSVVASSFRLLQNGSITVAATLQVAPDRLSATLTPNAPLQPLTAYTIVTTGISDFVGRTTSFESSVFTTGAGGQ